MTGGGFGGCVIGLMPCDRVAGAEAAVRDAFASAGFGAPATFTVAPSRGAHRVEE
jgi:galactokinase